MKFYFAPMEGMTGYIYRNAHNHFFGNIDKYYSPFISANQKGSFKTREINDISPENNHGLVLIPQLLTNNAQDFINSTAKIKELGYEEINLNLGCPSGTVVAKHKGSGFLAKREELDAFLEEIFTHSVMEISVKTRIGKDQPEEFYELIEIFNKYPIKELTIHPRIQKDIYKNKPNLPVFKDALKLSKNPVCYNGDITSVKDYKDFTAQFPEVDAIMIGRGSLNNPGLTGMILGNKAPDKLKLREFHNQVYEDYRKIMPGERNVLFKMKEFWFYLISMFGDNGKYAKRIKKSERLRDYEEAVASIFIELNIAINE
jgi:tRNA-dihydrouridine synthase